MADHDHQCAWACGNIADNVLINLNTSEADILCTPCFLRLANDIAQAFLSTQNQGAIPDEITPDTPRTDDTVGTSGQAAGGPDDPVGDQKDIRDRPEVPDPNSGGPRLIPPAPFKATLPLPARTSIDPDTGSFAPCPDCGETNTHRAGCVFA